MPRIRLGVLCALMMGLSTASSGQEAFSLGARVGPELDAAERAYFGLFPRAGDTLPFSFQTVDDSVRVLDANSNVLLAMSQEDAGRLTSILGSFETYPSVSLNPAWVARASFLKLINPRVPIPRAAPSRRIRALTAEGSYSGYVLYTTDSLVVLSPDFEPTNAELPGAFVLRRSQVTSIDRSTDVARQSWGSYAGTALGAGLGALIVPKDRLAGVGFGMVLGATLAEVVVMLRGGRGALAAPRELGEVAYFDGVRPPEMPGPEVARDLQGRPLPVPDPLPRRPRRYEWVSIGMHGDISIYQEDVFTDIRGRGVRSVNQQGEAVQFQDISVATRQVALEVPKRVDIAVRPLPWIRVGAYLGATDSTRIDELGGEDGVEYLTTDLGFFRPYVEGILPLPGWGRRRLELAAGVGRETHTLTARQVPPLMQRNYPVLETPNVARQQGSNWFTHVAAELYTTPFASLFFRYAFHPLPSLQVEEFTNRHRTNESLTLRRVYAHEQPFGFKELVIGARAHF